MNFVVVLTEKARVLNKMGVQIKIVAAARLRESEKAHQSNALRLCTLLVCDFRI